MRDFDDGVNALARLIGMLYRDVPYGKLIDDCRAEFDAARKRIMDKYNETEKEGSNDFKS